MRATARGSEEQMLEISEGESVEELGMPRMSQISLLSNCFRRLGVEREGGVVSADVL
jgi:hypothetical protein